MGFGKSFKKFAASASFAPFASTALSMAGDIYSAQQSRKAQQEANEANINLSREQMEFQRQMSNSSHQREVADLRLAGLNPALSANAGASTPVGASADIDALPPKVAMDTVRRGISSAIEMKAFHKQMEEADARIDNIKTDSKLKGANAYIEEKKKTILQHLFDKFLTPSAKKVKQLDDADKSRNKRRVYSERDQKWKVLDIDIDRR